MEDPLQRIKVILGNGFPGRRGKVNWFQKKVYYRFLIIIRERLELP